uniref:hypothetical protein n=1 Tax=Hylemonella sp. TaxID=2066020 RepID=UPI0035AE91FE
MEYIEHHTQGTLTLQLPELCIVQQGVEAPITYVGSGRISQREGRALYLSMLVKAPEGRNPLHDIFKLHDLIQNAVPGQPFPAENFFRIEGTDLGGISWSSENLLINASGPHALGYFEITAKIDRIQTVHALSHVNTSQYVRVFIPVEFEIPGPKGCVPNSFNRVLVKSPDDTTELEHNGRQWSFEKQRQWTVVMVSAEEKICPARLAEEICHALTFSFGQECRAAVVDYLDHGKKVCQLISYQAIVRPKHRLPPLDERKRINMENFWRLFFAFTDAIERERGDQWPSIVRSTVSSTRIKEASLEAKALVLCVEIESLIKAKFMQLYKPHENVRQNLVALERMLTDSKLPADFLVRVRGATGRLSEGRAQDVLQLLVQKGVLDEVEVKTWQSLRNASAHGARTSKSIDVYLTQVHRMHSLLHKLIFLLIGYQGRFTDYGAPGWVDRDFTPLFEHVVSG